MRLPPLKLTLADLQRNWSALKSTAMRRRRLPLESYSAHRFDLWRLKGWRKLLYFDSTDVLFLRNASGLLAESEPFSSILVRHGRCRPSPGTSLGRRQDQLSSGGTSLPYINAGIFVFSPSGAAADALSAAYQSGEFVYCGGTDGSLGNQDVIRQLAMETYQLGPFHEWSTCYNYRGWPEQRRKCPWEKLHLLHNDRMHWPAHLTVAGPKGPKVVRTSRLEGMMRAGHCVQDRAFPALVLPAAVHSAPSQAQ